MYDVIVVGARCAGAPLSMNLARGGHRVLVVDRAQFPSDTLSTHALTGDSVMRLQNWGVLDRVIAASGRPPGAPPKFFVDGQVFEVPGTSFAPRRTVLDKVLVDAAREAGAEIREDCSVSGLLRNNEGLVTGIQYQSNGSTATEEARIVVGADGRNSFVARQVGAEVYNEKEALACGYYSYFTGFPVEGIEVHFAPGLACFAFPTSHGQICLAVMQPTERFEEWRKDIEGGFRAAWETVGQGERFAQATRVEGFQGAAKLPNYYRKPFGPGWALVGDAGYLKDPVLGQGVNDAFRDAEALAQAIDRVLRGEVEFDAAMAGYQQARDMASGPIFAFNHEFSKLQVTAPLVATLIQASEAAIAHAMAQQAEAAAGG
jgi:flavin-dependent dehydrogenase